MQGKKFIFTAQQIEQAKNLYLIRRSAQWVGEQMSLSGHAAPLLLKQAGVYQTGRCIGNKKHDILEDYFSSINSHEKAYFLGFLWADGYNIAAPYSRNRKSQTVIHLQGRDKYILEYFVGLLYPNSARRVALKFRQRKNGNPSYTLGFRCYKMAEDLWNLGMTSSKTNISHIPNIDEKFLNSFMLGYFDGDGCIYLQKRKTGFPPKVTNANAVVDIVSNNTIIGEMVNYFARFGILFKTKFHRNPKYSHMYICSEDMIVKFYNHVYANQKIFLTRKHDKFVKFFEYKKTRGYGKEVTCL